MTGADPSQDMAAPGATGADALKAGLDEAAGAVALAQQAVSQGVFVDLGGLDRRVDQLCSAIRGLEPEEARTLEPVLADLIAALDSLEASLRQQNGVEPAEPTTPVDPDAAAEAAARARARSAYRRDR